MEFRSYKVLVGPLFLISTISSLSCRFENTTLVCGMQMISQCISSLCNLFRYPHHPQVVLPDTPVVLQDPVLLRIPELKALGSMVDTMFANSAAAGAASTLSAPIGSEQYRRQQAALIQKQKKEALGPIFLRFLPVDICPPVVIQAGDTASSSSANRKSSSAASRSHGGSGSDESSNGPLQVSLLAARFASSAAHAPPPGGSASANFQVAELWSTFFHVPTSLLSYQHNHGVVVLPPPHASGDSRALLTATDAHARLVCAPPFAALVLRRLFHQGVFTVTHPSRVAAAGVSSPSHQQYSRSPPASVPAASSSSSSSAPSPAQIELTAPKPLSGIKFASLTLVDGSINSKSQPVQLNSQALATTIFQHMHLEVVSASASSSKQQPKAANAAAAAQELTLASKFAKDVALLAVASNVSTNPNGGLRADRLSVLPFATAADRMASCVTLLLGGDGVLDELQVLSQCTGRPRVWCRMNF